MVNLKYLVVGTGRCGTVFCAKLLTECGINCGHEAIFDWRGFTNGCNIIKGKEKIKTSKCSEGNWFDPNKIVEAESSYMVVPYLNNSMFRNIKVIHVVRHPLKVISSFSKDVNFFNRKEDVFYENFVERYIPNIRNISDPLSKICYFYLEWNKLIEKYCRNKKYIRLKVEDLPNKEFFNFIERDKTESLVDKKTNSWAKRDRDYTIKEIPVKFREQIKHSILKYNYFNLTV